MGIVVMHVTNARPEGINSVIRWVKYASRGYRKPERFRLVFYSHLCGFALHSEAITW